MSVLPVDKVYRIVFSRLDAMVEEANSEGSQEYTGKVSKRLENWRVTKNIDVIDIIAGVATCWFQNKEVKRRLVPNYVPAGVGNAIEIFPGSGKIIDYLSWISPQFSYADLWAMAIQLFNPGALPQPPGLNLPLDRYGCTGKAISEMKSRCLPHRSARRQTYTSLEGDKVLHRVR